MHKSYVPESKEAYSIKMELKEEIVSKYWTVITAVKNNELLAIEFNKPDEPGKEEEILKFKDSFEYQGVKTPRIRNWYVKGTNEYLGSDIIVDELK